MMGYRSDLDAAQSRAAALEKRLASGEEENQALRQELEDIKRPKPKKKKTKKGPGALGKVFTPTIVGVLVSILLLAGAGYWSYHILAKSHQEFMVQEQADQDLVNSFVKAWAEKRYGEAWELTDSKYRAAVAKERFVEEMVNHPFVGGVEGATFNKNGLGTLHTAEGDLKIIASAYRGNFYGISSEGIDLLPPANDALVAGHHFVRALINKRYSAALEGTHPIYRKNVTLEHFANKLSTNMWLQSATGFQLSLVSGEDSAKELRGLLLTDEGSLSLVLSYSAGELRPWISEMSLGGRPSLPTP